MRRRLEATITIVAALAVLLAASYVILHKDPVKDAGQTPGFSLGATATSQAPTPSASSTAVTKPVVAFLGDDYTAGAGASGRSKGFVALLGPELSVTVRAASVTGGGYAKASNSGATYVDKASAIVKAKPQLVVVTGGRNDTPDDSATLARDTKKLFAELHQRLPRATLVAVTPFWGDSDPPTELKGVSKAVKAAVEAAGGTYVYVPDPLHKHPDWMADSANPNDKGHAAIAKALAAKLKPIVAKADLPGAQPETDGSMPGSWLSHPIRMLAAMGDITTIKVPRPLRERIAGGAAREGVTAADFLAELVDHYERGQRLAAVGRAYGQSVDADYADLSAEWDQTSADGLERTYEAR